MCRECYACACTYVFEKLFMKPQQQTRIETMQKRKWLAPPICRLRNRKILQSDRARGMCSSMLQNRPKANAERTKVAYYILLFDCYSRLLRTATSSSLSTIIQHPSGLFNTFTVCHWFQGVQCAVYCALCAMRSVRLFYLFHFPVVLPFFYDFCCFWINIFASCPGVCCHATSRSLRVRASSRFLCIFWSEFRLRRHTKHTLFIEYVESGWIALGVVNWLIEFNLVRRLPCIAIREPVLRTQCRSTTTPSPSLNIF